MHDKKLTLNEIKKSPKVTERVYRASDYLSQNELDDLHASNARGKKISKPYDEVDAFSAELLARFGWQAYQAWLSGEFKMSSALRFIAAERARDKQQLIHLEALILASNAGANNPDKHGHAPKSLKRAQEIFNNEVKVAQGAQQ